MGWDPGRVSARSRLQALARLVRIEHTLFSLPFAYVGAVLACSSCLTPSKALLIATAVAGLRVAAMAQNNLADMDIDALNPRTRNRPLVVGAVSVGDALALVFGGTIVYLVSAALLNRYALLLSPLLWIPAMTYPYAKRLHPLPHLHLGLVLSLVVFGGAVAVVGENAVSLLELAVVTPWLYVVAVALWVAGFDILYSLQDASFDRRTRLGSLPAWLGLGRARKAALLMHVAASLLFLASIPVYRLGSLSLAGIVCAILLLAYQHYIVARRGIEAIARAFNVNLAIAPSVTLGILADKLVTHSL